jgi:hypothetical protein
MARDLVILAQPTGEVVMAAMWRKRKTSNTWHKCSNCPNWPTANYDASADPTSGETCRICRSKFKDDDCD